jgi:hypothetical protein
MPCAKQLYPISSQHDTADLSIRLGSAGLTARHGWFTMSIQPRVITKCFTISHGRVCWSRNAIMGYHKAMKENGLLVHFCLILAFMARRGVRKWPVFILFELFLWPSILFTGVIFLNLSLRKPMNKNKSLCNVWLLWGGHRWISRGRGFLNKCVHGRFVQWMNGCEGGSLKCCEWWNWNMKLNLLFRLFFECVFLFFDCLCELLLTHGFCLRKNPAEFKCSYVFSN